MNIQTLQVKNTTQLGRFGEEIALQYLLSRGYSFLNRNYHILGGEIDLILKKDDIIVFVEVKLRTYKHFGSGVEAVNYHKQQKILRSIYTFLNHINHHAVWQIDLIDIYYRPKSRTAFIQHLHNILEV